MLMNLHRSVGQCQAAIAEAVEAYGKVDILFCCASEGVFIPLANRTQWAVQVP